MISFTKRLSEKYFYHIISSIIILSLSSIPFYNSIFANGILMYVDMTWPTSIQRTFEIFIYTWLPYGSNSNFENVMRLLWSLPLLVPSLLLGIPMKIYLLILFISTFAISGITMYFTTYNLLNKVYGRRISNSCLSLCALIAALIYMYNPWSLNHLWTYFLYPPYALLPLIFFFLIQFFERKNFKYLILSALLSTFASTAPHAVIWVFVLYFSLFIYYLIAERRILQTLGRFLLLVLLYIILNFYWILPYLSALELPTYIETQAFSPQILYIFSQESSILKSIRLDGGWGLPIDYPKDPLWIMTSFVLPLFAYGFLVVYRRDLLRVRYLRYMYIMSLITLFLAKGSLPPLGSWYEWLVFKTPIGWVFRVPDRWLIFLSLSYAIIIAFNFSKLLLETSMRRKSRSIIFVVIVSFAVLHALFIYPIVLQYANKVFSPTLIPPEYLNSSRIEFDLNAKAIIIPLYRPGGFIPNWDLEKRIGPFLIYSFPITNINSFKWLFRPDSLLFIVESMLENNNMNPSVVSVKMDLNYSDCVRKIVSALGIKYVVLDTGIRYVDANWQLKTASSNMLQSLYESFGEPIYKSRYVYVFVNSFDPRPVYIPKIVFLATTPEDLCFLLPHFDNPQSIAIILQQKANTSFPLSYISKPDIVNLVMNPSFEENLTGWHFSTSETFTIELDSIVKLSGNYSLKLTTNSNHTYNIGWVIGREIAVKPGEWLKVVTHMKWENALWSHAAIYGYNESARSWQQIIHCPSIQEGSSDWKEYVCVFPVPNSITKVKVALAGGWVMDRSLGNATTWFDDIAVYKLDVSSIKSAFNATLWNYSMIDLVTWKANVTAKTPFLLVFAEAYDPLWEARVYKDGKLVETVRSIPVYGVINGFWIDKSGNLTIVIRYVPQDWFELGLKISAATFTLSIFYLVWDWRRGRSDRWAM